MITILLVDDQRLMCDGLKSMLETDTCLEVVDIAYNGKDAVDLVEKLHPDLVLLDIRMPEMDGVEAVLQIKKRFGDIKTVMLTTFNDDDYILEAIMNGADGYLLKDMDTSDLLNAVHNTMKGQMVMPVTVADSLKRGLMKIKQRKDAQVKLLDTGFTSREVEIAKLLADGFSNSQIATALYLSKGTIRNYISAIYEKLDTMDKGGAVSRLKEMGL